MPPLTKEQLACIIDHEIAIPLPNGGTLRCGEGEASSWGGYLRICDESGNEILFWERLEWEEPGQGELVIGAVFAAAIKSLADLKKGRVIEDGVWVHDRDAK